MNCDQCQSIVQNLLDGGLRQLPESVREHLQTCAECAAFFEDLQLLQDEMAHMEKGGLSPAGVELLASGIRRRLEAEFEKQTADRWHPVAEIQKFKWWAPAGAVALGLLILLLRTVVFPPAPVAPEMNELQVLLEEHSRLAEPPVLNPAPYDVTFIAMGNE